MGSYRPKNKFEHYFTAIGEFLYLVVLLSAATFIIGYAFYQLFTGNFAWFKENGGFDFLVILILAIVFGLFFTDRKKKKKL
jgi:hypothetical protein